MHCLQGNGAAPAGLSLEAVRAAGAPAGTALWGLGWLLTNAYERLAKAAGLQLGWDQACCRKNRVADGETVGGMYAMLPVGQALEPCTAAIARATLPCTAAAAAGITGSELPPRHALTVSVPGAAALWEEAVQRWGSGSSNLADVLAPAIELAEGGFPVGPVASFEWQRGAECIRQAGGPGARALTTEEGSGPKPGQVWRNADLAATFRRLAEHGAAKGAGAQRMLLAAAWRTWGRPVQPHWAGAGRAALRLHSRDAQHVPAGTAAAEVIRSACCRLPLVESTVLGLLRHATGGRWNCCLSQPLSQPHRSAARHHALLYVANARLLQASTLVLWLRPLWLLCSRGVAS